MPDEINPIIGHNLGWGLTGARFPVRPFQLTPGAIDTMQVRVREKIDIHGVGTDVVELEGSFTVARDTPRPLQENAAVNWGEALVGTEFRSLELHGESAVFGTVRVRLNPNKVSQGLVGPADLNSRAAKCAADMSPLIELPDLNMTLNTGDQPVQLASKVISIPPIGDVARSEKGASLQDEGGNVVGELVSSDIEVGPVLFSVPLGNVPQPLGFSLLERVQPSR